MNNTVPNIVLPNSKEVITVQKLTANLVFNASPREIKDSFCRLNQAALSESQKLTPEETSEILFIQNELINYLEDLVAIYSV